MSKHKVFRLSPSPDFLPFKPFTTYVGADDEIRKLEEFIFDSADEKLPRLAVNLVGRRITLDRKTYDVGSINALRWVKVLAEHPGEWIAGPELCTHDSELQNPRTDRWRKQLPKAIQLLIDSGTGKGSRIKL